MKSAIMRIRAARARMRALKYEAGEGGRLRELRDELGRAAAEFEDVAGMPLADFTETVQEGLTVDEPKGAVELRVLEPMSP